jgi:xanthine dehydrogenase small subunit
LRNSIQFIFRGQTTGLKDFSPTRSLLDWLREDQRATGTKEGCNEGDCGACTVVLVRLEGGQLVHRPVNACITLLGMIDGAELLTVEDLSAGGKLHPIQQAMVEHHASQCGFCTPGIVMSLFALGKESSESAGQGEVTRQQINDQLSGNLCRCTGYRPIIDAALSSLNAPQRDHLDARADDRAQRLLSLTRPATDEGVFVKTDEGFFAAPRRVADVLRLLSEYPDATLVAGATDVGLWITKQFRPLRRIIWLGHVEALQKVSDRAGWLELGAGVLHETAIPHLAKIAPDLALLGQRFGSRQVRAQGTIGGNIANGSPIGDWPPAFIALGAELDLIKLDHAQKAVERRIPLEAFFIAYGKQDREPAELVQRLSIPRLKADEHFRCFKISKRFDEDIAALTGAFKLTVSNSRISHARVAFGGMAATPRRATRTEAALIGTHLSDPKTWDVAVAALAHDFQPIDDMRASAAYRQETAGALLRRTLIEIANGKEGGTGTRLRELKMQEVSHAP